MKKFLVFFAVLFGVCGGTWARSNYPNNEQDNAVNYGCGNIFEGQGFLEFIVYFDNAESQPKAGCDFSEWKSTLDGMKDDIGSVLVFGSADRMRRDGKPDKNVILSKDRAQWVLDNIVPYEFASQCTKWQGIQNGKCQVHAMSDADDMSHSSDNGARNPNADARAAHIYVAWAVSQCTQGFIDNMNILEQELREINDKYSPQDVKIENKEQTLADVQSMLNQVRECKAKCPSVGTSLYKTDTDYIQNNCTSSLLSIINKLPTEVQVELEQTVTTISINTEIDSLYASLKDTIVGLKLSVWRDTEGRFNTARLASDSIAGVVLGTVGGLVTANVVKKNQLKKGFEDINCSVGGQNVAKYGDQMRVGL